VAKKARDKHPVLDILSWYQLSSQIIILALKG